MMKRYIFTLICCCSLSLIAAAQTFQQRSDANKQAYIKSKAEQIGALIAQRPVELSPAYLALVKARVEAYAKRVGIQTQGVPGKEELGLVLVRGTNHAATFAKVFQARNLSPLVGIYLPMMILLANPLFGVRG